jgi:alpha-L-fucosidase
MKWFDDAKFGMFIHWGIYSVPAGEWQGKTNYAEWIMLQGNIPSAEYRKFAGEFDPVKFDARAWVRAAKDAGMKYLVITAKHHDGFCMYDTKLTDYSVVRATPWRHDPMRDLAAACRAAGIVSCFYYSVPDWHYPDFPAKYSQRGFHGDPNPAANLENYVTYMKGQVRELLSNYGPIGIMWFDGGGSFKNSDQPRAQLLHAQEIVDEIHALQPGCLVNNRLGLPGDYGTPEQKIPGAKQTNAFEVCMTLNRHWGYNKFDNRWKSSPVVISNLVDIASKGGNYLLNIGPTAEGVFPPQAVQILQEVGRWMKINGDSIYGTTASPLDSAPAWGRITQKGRRYYLHVFNWPQDGRIVVQNLPGAPVRASFLATKRRLTVTRDGAEFAISLPTSPLDNVDSVIVLETASAKSETR